MMYSVRFIVHAFVLLEQYWVIDVRIVVAVTSRIGFAMARDGAFPGSAFIRVVNQRLKMPLR